jgi:hypothetical protein
MRVEEFEKENIHQIELIFNTISSYIYTRLGQKLRKLHHIALKLMNGILCRLAHLPGTGCSKPFQLRVGGFTRDTSCCCAASTTACRKSIRERIDDPFLEAISIDYI